MAFSPKNMTRGTRIGLFSGAFILVLLVGNLIWFWAASRRFVDLASNGGRLGQLSPSHSEAIVVLAGDYNRIPSALKLLRDRNGPMILLSGVDPSVPLVEIVNSQGASAVDIHKIWERIVTESKSRTTIENALEAARILREKEITRIILVTSDYHMARASRIFRNTMPETELLEFPVTSEFTDLKIAGVRKFFVEYWKNLLYSLGILHFLS